ncbi:MAG: hypothetical protein UX09_C0022G0001, partial [Candidatus Uhrbacteria bacterium GW2011_GWE2_45_35]
FGELDRGHGDVGRTADDDSGLGGRGRDVEVESYWQSREERRDESEQEEDVHGFLHSAPWLVFGADRLY